MWPKLFRMSFYKLLHWH
nr:unnamed protein product [Callosobruchus chinensis]